MSKEFRNTVILLREDLDFERTAVRTYCDFVERIEALSIKDMFRSLAEDESAHAAGLTEMLNALKAGKFEMKFYCPRCGWILNFGKGLHVEREVKCPICGNVFRLTEMSGDYSLEEI